MRIGMKAMLLSLLSLSFSSFAASCTASGEIVGIHMSSEETVTVPYGEFTYDGINVTIDYRDGNTREIPLVEDMISDIEKLKFFKVGNNGILDCSITHRQYVGDIFKNKRLRGKVSNHSNE
jgi:hypothetical protein